MSSLKRSIIGGLLAISILSGCEFLDEKQVEWTEFIGGQTAFVIYSQATAELRYLLVNHGQSTVRTALLGADYDSELTEDFLTGPGTETDQFLFYTRLAESTSGDCLIAGTYSWTVWPSDFYLCQVGETSAQ